ncbi:TIGR00153 family protein [Vibrio gallicus]|uniref:TIGR00153 family protein n=1 Tax=Vibrio gallicus TaxID=190897 RepID=UPI0021C45F11|nr:TIGR00153 family protein [Vibrio gallicus]
MPVNTIMGLFAKSPIKPLQQHVAKVQECCSLLPQFFDAANNGEWDKATDYQQQISSLEKDADALKRQIRLHLPSGLFMAMDRRDLLDVLTQQDRVANLAKDICGRVIGRQLLVPHSMYPDFVTYVNRCLDAVGQMYSVINGLEELLETGFKGREVTLIASMIDELDRIEDDTDNMQIGLRQNLLAIEQDYSPVDVMFLYKILEWVGAIADQAQRVCARLELMIAR